MSKTYRRATISLLSTFLVGLLALDLFVRFADPWGLGRYRTDNTNLYFTYQPDATRLYKLTPGSYTFSNWTLTVNADTFRRVPETNEQADCTIALIGDSGTFAFGVSDNETWSNLLAQRYPDVHILNTGVNGYNTFLVYRTAQSVEADGYLYLIIENDAESAGFRDLRGSTPLDMIRPSLRDYLVFYRQRSLPELQPPRDYTMFDTAIARLRELPAITILGFEILPLTLRADAVAIPMFRHQNSWADGHPDAQGNIEIADSVEPEFARLVEKVC